jgi:hypothetical protein
MLLLESGGYARAMNLSGSSVARAIAGAFGGLTLAGCSLFGIRSGYEQPPYAVVATLPGEVEIRQYAPRLAAETTVEASDRQDGMSSAFRVLASYIFGENRARTKVSMTAPVAVEGEAEKIAMTAPVETAMAGGTVTMRFFMPARWTRDTLPEPTDARIRIVDVPGETLAVLRFSGLGREDAVDAQTTRLLAALAAAGYEPVGEPITLYYDPPWTLPFLRRNEVAVRVMQP